MRGGGADPGQQCKTDFRPPGRDDVLVLDPVCTLTQGNRAQLETIAAGKTGEQEMQAGETVSRHENHPVLKVFSRQRHDQRGQCRGDILGGCQRGRWRLEKLTPQINEPLPLSQRIAPLLVIGCPPALGERRQRGRHILGLARILPDRVVKHVA